MERKNKPIKFVLKNIIFVLSLFSCKQLTMDSLIDEYNAMFVPSENILWTIENIKKSTLDFEHFNFNENGYEVTRNTGIFILGGPRDCTRYIWTLNGALKSGDQILKLHIKNETIDSNTGTWIDNGSLSAGNYDLRLTCTSSTGVNKTWNTVLTIKD